MRRLRVLRTAVICLVLGGWLVGITGQAGAREHYLRELGILTAERGREAPDFTLADPAGRAHRLRDLRGKVVLLGFGTTW
ncbi:MAG: hypothetical protein WAP47_09280 [Candidatus Rokuibacteriota bacterium]